MPRPPLRFVVPGDGVRIDRLVADASGLGRRQVKRWLHDGLVRIDGHFARPGDVAPSGAIVDVAVDDAAPGESAGGGHAGGLDVVFENEELAVVAKPANLHCERGLSADSVADLLEKRYGDLSGIGTRPGEAGLVHRLDRDTSGVLAAARTPAAYLRLRRAFAQGRTRKQYLALVAGKVDRPFCVDEPLAGRGARMAIARELEEGRPAQTFAHPLEAGEGWSLVLATMRSGLRHQVRVHLASRGFPLVGDELYGGPSLPGCGRVGQLLHALRLQVDDEIDVTVPAPADFLAALALLRRGE